MLLRAAKERRGETAMRAMADIVKLCKKQENTNTNTRKYKYKKMRAMAEIVKLCKCKEIQIQKQLQIPKLVKVQGMIKLSRETLSSPADK